MSKRHWHSREKEIIEGGIRNFVDYLEHIANGGIYAGTDIRLSNAVGKVVSFGKKKGIAETKQKVKEIIDERLNEIGTQWEMYNAIEVLKSIEKEVEKI